MIHYIQNIHVVGHEALLSIRRFDSRQGLGIFLFITASRSALGPTQPPIYWEPESLSRR